MACTMAGDVAVGSPGAVVASTMAGDVAVGGGAVAVAAGSVGVAASPPHAKATKRITAARLVILRRIEDAIRNIDSPFYVKCAMRHLGKGYLRLTLH